MRKPLAGELRSNVIGKKKKRREFRGKCRDSNFLNETQKKKRERESVKARREKEDLRGKERREECAMSVATGEKRREKGERKLEK